MNFAWIESGGGPLVVLPDCVVAQWGGCHFSPDCDEVSELNIEQPVTDYDRACCIDDYLGVVNVGALHALILGDEPLRTTWTPHRAAAGGVFIRWQFAPAETDVCDWIDETLVANVGPPEILWSVPSSSAIIMDSAIRGRDLATEQGLTLHIAPGRYRVSTCLFRPHPEIGLLLHKLQIANP